MPNLNLTPRPDKSPKMPMPEAFRPRGAIDGPYQPALPTARPAGVAVVALISFLLGIVLLIPLAATVFQPSDTASRAYWVLVPALIALVFSVGLWLLRSWARIMAIVFYSLAALSVLGLMLLFPTAFNLGMLLAIFVPALIVVYLLSKSVRYAFERKVAA